jgi:hypothetical protein
MLTVLIHLTSCGTLDRMTCLVNQSTDSIYANIEVVETSTAVIRQNSQLVDESSKTIEENHKLLQAAAGS